MPMSRLSRLTLSQQHPHLHRLSHEQSAVRERTTDGDGVFHIHREQTVDEVLAGVRAAADHIKKKTKGDGARYVGSVPLIVAEIWAKECKAPVGSREFTQYAHGKLQSGEFAKLKATLK